MTVTTVGQDSDLLVDLAADLDGSFHRLVLAHQDRLYGFALRLSGNSQDAEEIAQDAFVRGYRALKEYEPERVRSLAVGPWLHRIALNAFRNRYRRKAHPMVPLSGGEEDGSPELELRDGAAVQPEVVAERAEERARLVGLLAALPEGYRVAVVLRHVQGLPYGEVAELLGVPVGTAKARVHRGLKLLRAGLERAERRELVGRRCADG